MHYKVYYTVSHLFRLPDRLLTHAPPVDLNTPKPHPTSLRPREIISALSNHSPGKHNSLFSSREHQDAQELFQLLSECIKDETAAIDKEGHRDRGLSGLGGKVTQDGKRSEKENIGNVKSVFDGLTANRRSCMECGYTEAVMHFAFDNWQLAVPRMSVSLD
jgi:ubiquitin carboxyl-terminal hydrolase 1